MSELAIKLTGVSKAFPLLRRNVTRGIDRSVGAAFSTLVQSVLKGPPRVTKTSENHLLALNDVTLDIARGEVFGIIGRNGAGKSTLLKLLARVMQPTAGRIELRGRVASLLELGLGMSEDLTVRENIHLQGRLAGLSHKEVLESEERILEFSGLGRFRDAYLNSCPSGSFIRLSFSTMINLRADIILADEVLAVGDSAFRKTCMDHIESVGGRGETVLFVSHDMRAVKKLCTRTVWIDHGHVRMVGDTDEVVDAYTQELLAVQGDGAVADQGPSRISDLQILGPDGNPVGALEMSYGGYVQAIVVLGDRSTQARLELELNKGRTAVVRDVSPPLTGEQSRILSIRWKIPANYLNETKYSVKAGLAIEVDKEQAPEAEKQPRMTVDFDVYNTVPERSVWADWEWGRGGAISPELNWSCTGEDGSEQLPGQSRTGNEQ